MFLMYVKRELNSDIQLIQGSLPHIALYPYINFSILKQQVDYYYQ